MKNRATLIFLTLIMATGAAQAANPAPLTYKNVSGKTASVLLVTGVDAQGSPQVPSYIGPDGKSHSPLVQEKVCSVENGTPYLCDAEVASNAALVLSDEDAPVSAGAWPTTDPLVVGQAWQDHGVMMLSTGSAAAPTFDGSLLNVSAGGQTYTLQSWMGGLNYAAQTASTKATAAQTAADAAQTTANAAIPLTQKGAVSGVAALDANGNVTAPILTTKASSTGAITVGGNLSVSGISAINGILNVTNTSGMATFNSAGTKQSWYIRRSAASVTNNMYTLLASFNGTSTNSVYLYDTGAITTALGTVANLGADAPFTGTVSAATLSASTSAFVPDTATTDSTTAALNTESAAARFVAKTDESNFATDTDLAAYLKSSDAASTYLTIADAGQYATLTQVTSQLSSYAKSSDLNSAVQTLMPIAGGTFTGTVKAPTPAAGDNGTNVATTAFVNTAVQGASGSVVGDISASGSSLAMPVGSSGLTLTMSYVSSGTGSLSIVSTNGTITPVDIYESAVWGGGSVKTYILDSGTVTTTATTVDSTFYLNSNAWGTYHIRANGVLYVVDVFGSGKGARTTMSWRKLG